MANTPNLDLVKPAGTDKALVSVINSNSDKIDTGFGSLSNQIGTLNDKSFNTIADTSKTNMDLAFLNSIRSSMSNGQIAMVKVSNFSGIAFRYNTDYMQILSFTYSNLGEITVYTYVAGTWRKRIADMGTATVISQ